MRYRKPFDLVQRQDAIAAYHAMRAHVKLMAASYPPRDRAERAVLKDYRRAVRAFGENLMRPDARVDVAFLNHAGETAVKAFAEYYGLRVEGESS